MSICFLGLNFDLCVCVIILGRFSLIFFVFFFKMIVICLDVLLSIVQKFILF